jgi:hypothetical protein
MTQEEFDAGKITAQSIRASDIEVGHLAMLVIDTKTGKQGVRHLYSDRWRERWPQEQYPELYEEDTI